MSRQGESARRQRTAAPWDIPPFLAEVAARGHDPLLHQAEGTLRIDLVGPEGTDRWYVTLTRGDVRVARRGGKAAAVLCTGHDLFDDMCAGRVNATAAMLRGVLQVDGDLGLVTMFARLLPGPARSQKTFLERQRALAERKEQLRP